jgi:hypothetical protein
MLDWCRASGLAPGKRQQASAFQGLRPTGSEGAIIDGNPGVSLGTREGKKTGLCGTQSAWIVPGAIAGLVQGQGHWLVC